MKLRNMIVSTLAGAGLLATVGCNELNNNTYIGNPDKGSRADAHLVSDAGVDVHTADAISPDKMVADLVVPDVLPLDKTVADLPFKDQKGPDSKLSDSQLPDSYNADATSSDTGSADMVAPDAMALDKTVADLIKSDTTQLDKAVADKMASKPDNAYKADMLLPDSTVVTLDQKATDLTKPDYATLDAASKKDGAIVVFKDGLTGDVASTDGGNGCQNLSEMLTCLGTKYQTLVSPGWSLNVALKNGYQGITDKPAKFKQGVAAGNPCTAPKIFTDSNCVAYFQKSTSGSATVELKDGYNARITGRMPSDQDMGLEALSSKKLYGKNCVITGSNLKTATIKCFK